jgi:hypothetical protein
MTDDTYVTDEEHGDRWRLMLGDSCERLAEIESDSVALSVFSPPFADLYVYSGSVRDLGNSRSHDEFFEHYSFVIRELLRVTMPGRLCAVHASEIPITKARHGYIGTYDFPGDLVRAHVDAGWIYNRRWTINKDPQAQALRTKAHCLAFPTLEKDSAKSAPALADYVLLFRAPGDNAVPVKTDVTRDEWIEFAAPVATVCDDPELMAYAAAPAWMDIRETKTLNAAIAKEDADSRHICPLQLGLIERCVRLWSNPGETVLSPFAGIGSEIYMAVKLGRCGAGVELKASYWRTAVTNLRRLDAEMQQNSLFDLRGEAS